MPAQERPLTREPGHRFQQTVEVGVTSVNR